MFRGFVQVEKVSLQHRMFNQNDFIPQIQRELIQRKTAAGVLLYNDAQQRFALIEQFRVGAIDDPDSPWQLEIIAGVLDGDESPAVFAVKVWKSLVVRLMNSSIYLAFIHRLAHVLKCFIFMLLRLTYQSMVVYGLADEGENIQLHIFDITSCSRFCSWSSQKCACDYGVTMVKSKN
jgi:ADP-ribose pyrophosphatase